MPRRRASEDEDGWADWHAGDCASGHISQLREQNPPGEPFEPKREPIGFVVDPAAYKARKARRKAKP